LGQSFLASRRAVLAKVAGLFSAVAVASFWPWRAFAMQPPQRFDPASANFLTDDERSFITAAVDRLLPADAHGPGGVAAGVPRFIDSQLAGPWGRGDDRYTAGPVRQTDNPTLGNQSPQSRAAFYRASIAALRKIEKGGDFERQPADVQDAFLAELQQGKHDSPGLNGAQFFVALLQDSVQGFMADPLYGGNRDFIGWKLIGYPGVRYDWTPYMQNAGKPLDLPLVGTFGPADNYGLN
jgi:gluconate 2-dehydrogenase gamma chain